MMKREGQIRSLLCCGTMIAALLCWAARPSAAADVNLCVTMAGSSGAVGGLQMDLAWDAGCMTAVKAQGDAAKCRSNPSTGKNVQTKITGNAMRAIFLSMSDSSPVPDGELFCCAFTAAQAGQCCSASIGNLILASPTGTRLYATDLPDISVEAQVNGMPCTAAQPSGSQANPIRPPAAPMAAPPAAVLAPGAVGGAAGGGVPVPQPVPPQNAPRGMPPVMGGQAAPTEEAAPAEAETPAAVTPAAAWTPTARRTPAAATPSPQARTPQPQATATVAATAATPVGATPTAPAKGKTHKRRRHTS